MQAKRIKKDIGRPKANDPKLKFDSVRLRSSTLLDIELVAHGFDVSKSALVQLILENEMPKYKNLLNLENF